MFITTENTATEVSASYNVFSEINTQIRYFKLTAETMRVSGAVVHDIFPRSEAMPALEVLSITADQEIEDLCESDITAELGSCKRL